MNKNVKRAVKDFAIFFSSLIAFEVGRNFNCDWIVHISLAFISLKAISCAILLNSIVKQSEEETATANSTRESSFSKRNAS